MPEHREPQIKDMFCPQCGQQATDEVRYCPRCGLSLVPHAAILAGAQPAAAVPAAAPPPPARTRRRVNARRAAKLMFFSVVLIPLFVGLGILVDGGEPLLIPFSMFFVGLMWLVYSCLFIEDLPPAVPHASRRDLKAQGDRPALGAPQFVPASLFTQGRANTSEIAPPPSVTENTTTLLDKDL